MLTIELIKEAAARMAGHIHRTPVMTSRSFNQRAGREVFFKCENLQRAGAFKIRGATNKILSLSDEEKRRGVAAFSSGNHAQAVAVGGIGVGYGRTPSDEVNSSVRKGVLPSWRTWHPLVFLARMSLQKLPSARMTRRFDRQPRKQEGHKWRANRKLTGIGKKARHREAPG